MVFAWLDEYFGVGKSNKAAERNLETNKKYLRDRGIPIPTNATESVPDFFASDNDAKGYFQVVKSLDNQKTKGRLYSQKFTIGTREPFSYAERKRKSILSPDNPFTTEEGEGEQIALDLIGQHKDKLTGAVGLRKGGTVKHMGQSCCGKCRGAGKF